MQQFPKVNNLEDLLSLMQPMPAKPAPAIIPTFNLYSEKKSNKSNGGDFGEFDDFVGASEAKQIDIFGAKSLPTLKDFEKDQDEFDEF